MRNHVCISFFTLLISFNIHAQIGGNQLYQNQKTNYNRTPVTTSSIHSTDSTLVITSRVLMNKEAEHYLITLGINQTDKTVELANKQSNDRINQLLKDLKSVGIKKKDIYVDFISETKVYDHKISQNEIQEFFEGFNMRRNLIIQVSDLEKIDQIINLAARQEIHDIVKVDYVIKDLEQVNDELFDHAMQVIESKKKRFERTSSTPLTNKDQLVKEKFEVYYPKNLYKKYNEAFETSLVNTHYQSHYIKKEISKEKSFYYDGVESDLGINKIIDEVSPQVGIQFVIDVQMVYEIDRNSVDK